MNRPRYHLLPPANWLNDPNGLIQWNGQYHLFYQYNPNGAFHGTIHWGHAISNDLAHWQHLPIALAPDMPFDKDGVWSGCIVNNNGIPTLLYTGVHPQVQCLAWSEDDLLTFKKHPQPVISTPPADLPIVSSGVDMPDWRDPYVWREGTTWYMLVGTGIVDVGGTALLYESPDLLHWKYLQPILIGNKDETGVVWECPNLIPLGEKYAFFFSPLPEALYTCYYIGDYTQQQFSPHRNGKADYGKYFYAAQVMRDWQNRALMWGWLKEGRSASAQQEAGWSGVMALPRILTLASDGTLRQTPAPEISLLRDRHWRWDNLTVGAESAPLVRSQCVEIQATFVNTNAEKFGFWLHASDLERTLIAYDAEQHTFVVDRTHASLSPDVDADVQTVLLPQVAAKRISMRIFVDYSVIEIFIGESFCFTTRVYPIQPTSSGISPVAFGGNATLESLDIWTMNSAIEEQ